MGEADSRGESEREDYEGRRSMARRLPRLHAPRQLQASLQVLASRERSRAINAHFSWKDRVHMFVRDLMRPFAVPAFGGLASAVVIFSALMPSLVMPIPVVRDDVPLAFTTQPSVRYFAPIGISESELVVDLTIDTAGRMVDYTVVSGANMLKDTYLKRQLENNLLFTEFTPATKFGGPASGRVRLYIKSSQITIHG